MKAQHICSGLMTVDQQLFLEKANLMQLAVVEMFPKEFSK
jgi:hypothetical protein